EAAEKTRLAWRISTIGASADSSTAVAFNSAVWQWGGISERLEDDQGGHGRKSFPHCVMQPGRLRPIRDTQAHVSVSQFGRWALLMSQGRPGQRDELAHRVAVVENLRLEIAGNREKLARMDAAHKKAAEERLARAGGGADGQSLGHFHDTVTQLTQESPPAAAPPVRVLLSEAGTPALCPWRAVLPSQD
ncbi:unnamed protein product, partial [Prorocentrum cordatum]